MHTYPRRQFYVFRPRISYSSERQDIYARMGCFSHLEIIDDSIAGRRLKLHYLAQFVLDAAEAANSQPYYREHATAVEKFYAEETEALRCLEQESTSHD